MNDMFVFSQLFFLIWLLISWVVYVDFYWNVFCDKWHFILFINRIPMGITRIKSWNGPCDVYVQWENERKGKTHIRSLNTNNTSKFSKPFFPLHGLLIKHQHIRSCTMNIVFTCIYLCFYLLTNHHLNINPWFLIISNVLLNATPQYYFLF